MNEDGIGLPRATILVEDKTTGATTDNDGLFKLSVTNTESVQIIKYISY